MDDTDKSLSTESPDKKSAGRGILAQVIGEKVRGIGRGSGAVADQTNGPVGTSGSLSSGPKEKGSGGQRGGGRGGSKWAERRDDNQRSNEKTHTGSDRTSGFHVNGKTGSEQENTGPGDNRSGRGRGGRGRGGRFRGGFSGRGGRDRQGGQWICPDINCGNRNFAFRKVCQKCEAPRPEHSHGGDQDSKTPYIPPTPSDKEEDIFSGAVQKGSNFDKYDDIPVEVSGQDQCGFITSFDDVDFYPAFLQNLKRADYDKPTPIQKYSIPIIMAGRDLMACAQTGSGKTAAFLLPVLTAMLKEELGTDEKQDVQKPLAVCIAPTRELALQIYNDCRKFAYRSSIRAVVLYGGTSVEYQMKEIEKGAHFVIGTPGRLLDVINKGKISLENVAFLILDEADRMLDMGFEPDVRKLVNSTGMPLKTERQTLMFSATFPEEIQKLAADFLNNYLFVTVGRVGGANMDVSQNFFEVDRLQKRESLCDILNAGGGEKTLVFVELKRNADFLASYLCQSGFPTTSIHGDRLQKEREEALNDFKSGKVHVLVATSVAARGLDIPEVMHVINYDLPASIDEYVHRIGRTGRCGNLGKATSFFNAEADLPLAANLVRILKEAQQPVPEWLVEYSRGMGAGDAGGFSARFGSKDIRKGKFSGGDQTKHKSGGDGLTAGVQADEEEAAWQ